MLNQEFKKEWLEELRSGKYRQGKQRLKKEIDGEMHYCCLGVACEILKLEFKPDPVREEAYVLPSGNVAYLDDATMDKIGMDFATMDHLANMNDLKDKTFAEIADWIEENL